MSSEQKNNANTLAFTLATLVLSLITLSFIF